MSHRPTPITARVIAFNLDGPKIIVTAKFPLAPDDWEFIRFVKEDDLLQVGNEVIITVERKYK